MAQDRPAAGPSAAHPASETCTTTFTPRPFPPPALDGIPMEYIVDTLHALAPSYWNNLETSDCTIIFPIDPQRAQSFLRDSTISIQTPHVELSTSAHDPAGLGRRVTAPDLRSAVHPRMLMRLHVDYLSAHSALLRHIFSGVHPLDLISAAPSSAPSHDPHAPRLLPSTPHHPAIFLPVPDPTSFHYLVTYMYFGVTDLIDDALRRRVLRWEGVARNVEYLGMGSDIKMFLGRWYHRWLRPAQPCAAPADNDDDDDAMGSEDDTPHAHAADEPPRGRSRDRGSTAPSSH